jgi:glycosyltransferase involved in cell wall biosynthesis
MNGLKTEPGTRTARRVTLVANELRGFYPAGGMGTATTFLALALARLGHTIEILVSWQAGRPIDPYWQGMYEQAGIGIRRVRESGEEVEPAHFAVPRNVELALRADPPEICIVQDLNAPGYSALRMRQLGLGLEQTLFVVFCHGTRRWITEMSRRVGVKDLRELLAVSVLERASMELADIVVSPSAYLLDWMRDAGWRLPQRTYVIPYFTRSDATGEPAENRRWSEDGDRLERIAFFGRLEDKKGIRPFVAGLNALDPTLLDGVQLEFVGKSTATWDPARIEALLTADTRRGLHSVTFAGDLDQHEALAHLSRPGTLAVIPSLGDNSPNTVYECLEHGIPFIASDVGGIPELVAAEDRAQVLCEPTAAGIARALGTVLSGSRALRPARAAFDGSESYARWEEVLEQRPTPNRGVHAGGSIDVVVARRSASSSRSRCLAALERQTHGNFQVIESEGTLSEEARACGLAAGTADYVVFLDETDRPDPELLATLAQAQAASDADVVTCALRLGECGERVHFFSGDPGGLGALSNDYGNIALFRRSRLAGLESAAPCDSDPDWPLLAGLALSGAKIHSVPAPLVARAAGPGSVGDAPGDALLVLEQFEQRLPDTARLIPRVAAGLAASEVDAPARPATFTRRMAGAACRVLRRLR